MNKHTTRNLIASVILALLVPLGLIALFSGTSEVAASFGVVAALAILGAIELRGASRRLPERQPKGSTEYYRSAKFEA